MKLNHTTYVGKKCLHFITYNVLRGLKNIIQTQFKIQLSCRAAVLRDVNDCTLAIYQYWRESDWCNWIYSARTLQIWSAPADYEELAGGIKGAVSWKWEPSPKKIKTWKESMNNAPYKYKTRQGSTRRLKPIAIVGFEKQLFKVNFIVCFFWYNAWETFVWHEAVIW